MSYCSKEMVNRIEEVSEYTKIKNNPYELLDEIKKKMYGAGRSKYAFVGLTEQIDRILNTKQDDGENLVDYTKRFKQVRDNAKGSLGKKFLESFIKNTKEYKDNEELGNSKECKQMIKTSIRAWMAFLLLRNADNRKYGSLKRGFQTQHSLGNDQYPKTVTEQ